ncbi:Intracellular proteinase inhibitor BsuPI domain-containing protein [Mesobacillus thioparans]
MKKISLLIILLLIAVAPALAIGEEKQTPEQSEFSFYIDPLAGPEHAEFELTLQNLGEESLVFEFPTSQKYEIIVKDDQKNTVYQFSEGKAFAQAFEKLKLKPHESIKWRESWDYKKGESRVKEGEYTVTAQVKAISVNGKAVMDKQQLTDKKQMYIPGENPVFKGIHPEGSKGSYKIFGEARPIDGKFFYTVEDGHNELIAETEIVQHSKYPAWTPFTIEITLPESKLPKNGSLILNLYERSKEGEIIHTYPVLLERFVPRK